MGSEMCIRDRESGGVGTNNGGGLLVREFQGIGGSALGDLFTNPKWPNSPDLVPWSLRGKSPHHPCTLPQSQEYS